MTSIRRSTNKKPKFHILAYHNFAPAICAKLWRIYNKFTTRFLISNPVKHTCNDSFVMKLTFSNWMTKFHSLTSVWCLTLVALLVVAICHKSAERSSYCLRIIATTNSTTNVKHQADDKEWILVIQFEKMMSFITKL